MVIDDYNGCSQGYGNSHGRHGNSSLINGKCSSPVMLEVMVSGLTMSPIKQSQLFI